MSESFHEESSQQYLFVVVSLHWTLQDEIFPEDLHARVRLAIDETGGVVSVLQLAGLLSQTSP